MDGTTHSPAVATAEQRVSILLADRACTGCMFNLVGQMVVREKHYGMLIVRCPECGTVASLQEYPSLGRWANRWAAVAAALWFLVAIAATFAIAGTILGFTVGTMELSVQPLESLISKKYEQHQIAQGVPAGQANSWWNIDRNWWDGLDKAALMTEVGGLKGAVLWWGFLIWTVGFAVLFPLASVWAVAAAHRKGLRLLLTYVPMILIAGAFFVIGNAVPGTWLNARNLAMEMLMQYLLPICAGLAVIPLVAGAFFGRPLARLMVTLLLPPRLRVPLSFLWTCDGKSQPKPTW